VCVFVHVTTTPTTMTTYDGGCSDEIFDGDDDYDNSGDDDDSE